MARKRNIQSSGRTVLVIDDNAEYLTSTRRILEREGHAVRTAPGALEGLAILRQERVDLVLVDYFMPGLTGEDFVRELRTFNPLVQVILQTGYANEQPPREMLKRLDIQGYHDKSDGPEKLCLWVDVGLKAGYTLQLVEKSRLGLHYILNATPELHRIQALDDLLQGILVQTAGLLGAVDAFVAVVTPPRQNEGFVALVQEGGNVRVRAATGRFRDPSEVDHLLHGASREAVRASLEGTSPSLAGGAVAALRIGEQVLGMVYLDRPALEPSDRELLAIFANQAAVAIHNMALYEVAALDPLSGVFGRRFFDHAVVRELRAAYRTATPLGILMVDLDGMKTLNDTGGHLAGDRAIVATGRMLKEALRGDDVVCRYGGDEFVVLLPATDTAGVRVVADRVLRAFSTLAVEGPSGPMAVRGSVGGAVLAPRDELCVRPQAYFDEAGRRVLRAADEALYARKATKSGPAHVASVSWAADPAPTRTSSGKPPRYVSIRPGHFGLDLLRR